MAKCLHLIIVAVLLMSFICNQLLQSSDVEICASLIYCFIVLYLKTISENKLKAFNIGTMNIKKGVTKKEQEDMKKKVCVCVSTLEEPC